MEQWAPEVTSLDHPGLVHGFLSPGHVSPAAAAAAAAAAAGDEPFRRFGLVLYG